MNAMQNLEEIMNMAQNVQNELQKAQANLDNIEVEGKSGGGLVTVKATAKGRIVAVDVDESLLQPAEKQVVEDLIVAAFNDARAKADQASNEEMSKLTSGMQLPPGFKMPF
ncbi:nucleoid-associated protein [Stakelama pacifica]|nr:nucleoid-associated protein [Stakelama pacifica]